jgi:hypothetical protein
LPLALRLSCNAATFLHAVRLGALSDSNFAWRAAGAVGGSENGCLRLVLKMHFDLSDLCAAPPKNCVTAVV